ncbi:MAG: hypothetical protein ACP5NW_04700 [Candidatus Woesearchaeota archaeon]
MNNKKYCFAMIKSEGKYYIACDQQGVLTVRDTKDVFIKEFEALYELSKRTGYKNNTSAIINNSMFQPSIIEMSIEELSDKVFNLKEGTRVNRLNAVSGGFTGLYCNSKKNLDEIFENGCKPKLGLQ